MKKKKKRKEKKRKKDNVCKLCARNIGVLNKVKRFLPTITVLLYIFYILFISITIFELWLATIG